MTGEQPLVSVIVPTYNAELYVEKTINSVLAQTYQNLELIIVDDSSTDQTTVIIERYVDMDNRTKLITLNENTGGPAGPRNAGIEIARGEYLAFIDDDDLWHPAKLDIQIAVMREKALGFSSTSVACFTDEYEFLPLSGSQVPELESMSLPVLLRKNIIAASSVVLRADLLGSYRFSKQARHVGVEDYLFWLQLHQVDLLKSARLLLPLVAYRIRENSVSRQKRKMARKIFSLLGELKMNGNKLGWCRYYYFMTYIVGSLRGRMYRH
ncbi:MAG: glycosyltransferase family 2 protein [Arenicella sp.]|nr:glycosyltransferase family 2 protein [Arenicella sp.]